MTDTERREAARQFYNKWVNRGHEDEDDRSYWIDFLQDVMGVDHATDKIDFQKKVIGPDGNTKRIDAYIPETRVLIEQKSLNIDLSKPQAGHNGMTPYEQAKMYDNSLPVSEKAKWIIISNFAEIWVYDMDTKKPEPQKFALSDIPNKYSLFEFLTNQDQKEISHEETISMAAGKIVGNLYDALKKQYINPESEDSLRSLNVLCVRIVFCLYAEDALIFGPNGHIFHDYLKDIEPKDIRKALKELFIMLNTPEDMRDAYDRNTILGSFPYVNGGLFADENVEIPNFTSEIKDILLRQASAGFNWSEISPTIFGAVFESTLNPETRRSGGMHYTTIESIHKVIDPLFLDSLKRELDDIVSVSRDRVGKLQAYQDKLASLNWFDPACGSGNFLTETFLCIRRLENKVIFELEAMGKNAVKGQISFADASINPIKVSIQQFYGIEINDFAVTVAKTALWIAESQMIKETEDIIHGKIEFLPLKTNACIVEKNALNIDWNTVIENNKLNYIMGNPPFVGYALQNNRQKSEIVGLFSDISGKSSNSGRIDYVAGWYYKACEYMKNTDIEAAFVSTNSITQGEQVSAIWRPLKERFGLNIRFAWTSFDWDSQSNSKAAVWVVIIGFDVNPNKNRKKYIFSENSVNEVSHINAYLSEGEDVFIDPVSVPLCNVPPMVSGGKPVEDGNYILTEEEKTEFLAQEPSAEKYIKKYVGSDDFINGYTRYCIWLYNENPAEYSKMPLIRKKMEAVREYRLASKKAATRECANRPSEFMEIKKFDGQILIIPEVSTSKRRYIPIDYLDGNCICSNKVRYMSNASLYHFGVLTSNVHMAWVRTVCGRLGMGYDYSIKIVYNNFPWPSNITLDQKQKIETTAKRILEVRAMYSDCSLAILYDPLTMPPELQKAHQANDKAVMQAYGFSIKDMSEADCVAALMKMYQELIIKEE